MKEKWNDQMAQRIPRNYKLERATEITASAVIVIVE